MKDCLKRAQRSLDFKQTKLNVGVMVLTICVFLLSGCNQNSTVSKSEHEREIEEIINRIVLPEVPQKVFNILNYGAEENVYKNCKPAIDLAIKDCAKQGGGKIIVPAGDYFCRGTIHLLSNVNLHLEEGATITFSQNEKDFLPTVLVRWEGTECYNYSPYIYAKDQKNIAITGKGKFDGNAEGGFVKWRAKQKPSQKLLRQMGKDGVELTDRRFGTGSFLRPAFIQLMNCENILIEDIQIENVPFWVIQPTYCKSVVVRGVKIDSRNMNNDGCDPDSSEDVLIEDCWFRTGDDAIAIKSGRDNDGWRVNRPSKNIVIRNCKAELTLHGIAIGSELSGGVENVYIQNFTLAKVDNFALQFKSNMDRGGYIRNVHIDGMNIDSTNTAIYFTNDYHGYSGGESPTSFENISIKNMTCNYAIEKGIDMVGLKEKPINNVHFENVTIGKTGQGSQMLNVGTVSLKEVFIDKKKIESIEYFKTSAE